MKAFEQIYSIVSQIPKGKVMTYKQVAIVSGVNNPRIVGFAMRANKDTKKVPCHRVIGSDGTLRGYAFGGILEKKKKLEKEGVVFTNSETVDLSKSLLNDLFFSLHVISA